MQEPVPDWSLLKTYRGGKHPDTWGTYHDCFALPIDRVVTLPEFVYAFYTTAVFKLERLIIAYAVKLPSTDEQALQFARGSRARFSAWTLAEVSGNQLLASDFQDRTRSWFAVTPLQVGEHAGTVLRFGSGIASKYQDGQDTGQLTRGFKMLGRFHVLYSRVLLLAARQRLRRLAA
jgi:hypothetical protein